MPVAKLGYGHVEHRRERLTDKLNCCEADHQHKRRQEQVLDGAGTSFGAVREKGEDSGHAINSARYLPFSWARGPDGFQPFRTVTGRTAEAHAKRLNCAGGTLGCSE